MIDKIKEKATESNIEEDNMKNSNNFDAMMIAFDEGAQTLNE